VSKKNDKDDKIDGYGYFAVGCNDGTVVTWDLSRGVVVKSIGISGESEVPTCIAFSTDGKSIYVGSNGEKIIQYEVKTGEQISSFKSGKKGCLKISINPVANVIACGSTSVRLIDIDTGRKRKLDAPFTGGIPSKFC
jgi:WD40 repeat protein